MDDLLAPITLRFGAVKRMQVEALLHLEAQVGLRHKVRQKNTDARLRAVLDAQVQAMHQQLDVLRRAVGVYCMSYVRFILPPASEPL